LESLFPATHLSEAPCRPRDLHEEKARSERDRAERELTAGEVEGRCELADRYRKDAEAARRDVKRLEKARADLDKRREQLEQRMRQA
jgi:hypothetical protein